MNLSYARRRAKMAEAALRDYEEYGLPETDWRVVSTRKRLERYRAAAACQDGGFFNQMVVAFRRLLSDTGLDTAGAATNACGDASRAFAALLEWKGVECEIVQLHGIPDFVRRVKDFEPGEQEVHVVVRVGALYFDWTRRQYGPAVVPHVAKAEELEAEGWHIVSRQEAALAVGPGQGGGEEVLR